MLRVMVWCPPTPECGRRGARRWQRYTVEENCARAIFPVARYARLVVLCFVAAPSRCRDMRTQTMELMQANRQWSTRPADERFTSLYEIQVSLVGSRRFRAMTRGFPKSLEGKPVFLPGRAGRYRSDFEAWLERERIRIDVRAEVEDMALLRLFALSGQGLALVPEIVVQRELESRELAVIRKLKGFVETFYAVTTTKRFPNPYIEKIVRGFGAR